MQFRITIIGTAVYFITLLFGGYYIYNLKQENIILRQQDFTLATAFNQLSSRVTVLEDIPKETNK